MLKRLLSKKNRALLSELVRTDFKLRYQGSVLGYAWSLLRPLFMFVILYVVFAYVFKIGDNVPNFPIYLLLGIVMWNFFTETTQQGLTSIVGRGDLIRKIKIPSWLIVVSTSFNALINLAINLAVVIVFALITRMDLLSTSVLLPFYLLEIYALALGVSLLLSALYVKYRDVLYIWEVFLQAGFYLTPILYPVALITAVWAQKLMILNPLAQTIQGARKAFVTPESISISDIYSSNIVVLAPLALTLLVLVVGVLYFRSQSKNFAENL
ncbi:MAG: ABC transporter permease [bacterium]|nr:ABC transporter permease [bacterium]